jgi:hypothetical protein|tara:strand:- start:140 stop:439 length:300 start_codon:yes stop_codon:yes gene_type:complete
MASEFAKMVWALLTCTQVLAVRHLRVLKPARSVLVGAEGSMTALINFILIVPIATTVPMLARSMFKVIIAASPWLASGLPFLSGDCSPLVIFCIADRLR